jgi:hypothetical protein
MPRATRPRRYTAEGFRTLQILLAHIKHETDLNNAAEYTFEYFTSALGFSQTETRSISTWKSWFSSSIKIYNVYNTIFFIGTVWKFGFLIPRKALHHIKISELV